LSNALRGIEVAAEHVERTPVAAGTRGDEITRVVEHRGTKLYWRVDEVGLWGTMVPPRSATIELHSPFVEHLARASDPEGSFVFDVTLPKPYRLAVVEDGGSWATPWQN
jgi:hypothetical protein